jgi:serine phosphatase RsbU (regulator of sigma subunit)
MDGYPPRADLLGARPGDSVLLYTDGVSEAYDACGCRYPLAERAAAFSADGSGKPRHGGRRSLPELLRDDLLRHIDGDLRDDATLLHLRFAGVRAGARTAGPATEVTRAPIVRYQ